MIKNCTRPCSPIAGEEGSETTPLFHSCTHTPLSLPLNTNSCPSPATPPPLPTHLHILATPISASPRERGACVCVWGGGGGGGGREVSVWGGRREEERYIPTLLPPHTLTLLPPQQLPINTHLSPHITHHTPLLHTLTSLPSPHMHSSLSLPKHSP